MNESTEVEARLQVWLDRVDHSVKKTEWKRGMKTIKDNQKRASGVMEDENLGEGKEEQSVKANLIHATNQGMLPHIYAKNPEPAVNPQRWVGTNHPDLERIRKFSETAEIVLDVALGKKAGLKRELKAGVRAIQTSRMMCLKLTYHRDKYTDPLVKKELNDTQDNLARVERMLRQEEDSEGKSPEEIEAQKSEFLDTIAGLKANVEVTRAEGFVLDRIPIDRMIFDANLPGLDQYKQGRYMGYWTLMTVDKFMEQFPEVPQERIDRLTIRKDKVDPDDDDAYQAKSKENNTDKKGMVKVFEVWSMDTNSVYNWGEGDTDFAREPFQPTKQGERFYPFFCEGHHWVDGKFMPLSDVELMIQLQQEYDDTRKQFGEHRETNVATIFVDGSEVDDKTIQNVATNNGLRIVSLNLQGKPLQNAFHVAPPTNFDPRFYDTVAIQTDMQWVSGQQDADRGAVIKAKTLGEAEIAREGLASRVAERQDSIEDLLAEMYEYALEIALQEMSKEVVAKIAGPEGAEHWPFGEDKMDIFDMVSVEIQAGTTSKPDEGKKLASAEKIFPMIMEIVDRIMQMRQGGIDPNTNQPIQGIPDEQNPFKRILEELLKRYDERFDIDEFLPQQTQQEVQEQIPPEIQQALQGNVVPIDGQISALPPQIQQAG